MLKRREPAWSTGVRGRFLASLDSLVSVLHLTTSNASSPNPRAFLSRLASFFRADHERINLSQLTSIPMNVKETLDQFRSFMTNLESGILGRRHTSTAAPLSHIRSPGRFRSQQTSLSPWNR